MPVFKYLSLSLISIVHSFIFYESHCKPLSYFYITFSEKESNKRQSKDFVFKYLSLLVSYFYSSFIDFYASHCSLLFYFNRREREKSHKSSQVPTLHTNTKQPPFIAWCGQFAPQAKFEPPWCKVVRAAGEIARSWLWRREVGYMYVVLKKPLLAGALPTWCQL